MRRGEQFLIDFTKGVCMHVFSVTSVISDAWQLYGLQPARLLCPWDLPGKNNWVGCCALLQGIFPTEVSKLSPLHLLYCRHILYPLSYLGRSPSLKVVDSNPTEQLIKYYHNIIFVKAERIYHFFWVISQKINSKISLYIFSLNIILKKRKFMNLTPPISEACSKNLSILT